MKATIESTDAVVLVDRAGVKARVWEGVSDQGVQFTAYIAFVVARCDADQATLERALTQHKPAEPDTLRGIKRDLRLIL